jgi:hypothetical protein
MSLPRRPSAAVAESESSAVDPPPTASNLGRERTKITTSQSERWNGTLRVILFCSEAGSAG